MLSGIVLYLALRPRTTSIELAASAVVATDNSGDPDPPRHGERLIPMATETEATVPPPPADGNAANPIQPAAALSPNEQPSTNALPARLQALLATPYRRPSSEMIRSIQPGDTEVLLALYQAEPVLTNRVTTMFALAATGDERALAAFQRTLATEFAGQSFQVLEVKIMMRHLEAIGLLGETSDAAIAFLKKSTAASDWEQPGRREWSSADNTEAWVNKALMTAAIQALGMSGRPESLETIMELAKGPSHRLPPVASAVEDAIFRHIFLAQNGRDAWNRVYFDGSMFEEYMKWNTGTEEGRRWAEWFQEILDSAPDEGQ